MTRTMIALYSSTSDARETMRELEENGFDREEISLLTRDRHVQDPLSEAEGDEGRSAEAAGRGALVGGAAGLLIGVGTLAVPGLGTAFAVGPLVSAIAGAAVGAGTGALVGALMADGVAESDAHSYAEGVRRGGTLLVAHVPDERWGEADDILDRRGPIDIGMRANEWRAQGWVHFDPAAEPYPLADSQERQREERTKP